MATPALKLLSDRRKQPIPVHFETTSIGELYRNCDFIKVCGRPPVGRQFGCTRKLALELDESEIQASCRKLANIKKPLDQLPHTYVDSDPNAIMRPNDIAVIHGCLGETYRRRKNLGHDVRQHIIDGVVASGYNPVILGSKSDLLKFWHKNDLSRCRSYLGKLSLKESVSKLEQCKFFISNDTGLYHVAGALKKRGMVIWKRTNHIKNKSPFKGITHVLAGKLSDQFITNSIDDYLDEQL